MPIVTTVRSVSEFTTSHHRLILGQAKDILQSTTIAQLLHIPEPLWIFTTEQLVQSSEVQLILDQKKVVFHLLPSQHSRHNSPSNTDAIREICKRICTSEDWDVAILGSAEHIEGQVCAAAKAFSLFSAKTTRIKKQNIHILPLVKERSVHHPHFQILIENIRLCGSLVDQPPSHFHVSNFIEMIVS